MKALAAKEIPTTVTPMMRQYLELKASHPDAIVFYRLGDFYEMFFDDAHVASKILDLTLTARNKNSDEAVPMCGVPYHAAAGYIAKLIENGKKVVVCEQTEDPKLAKGIVKREVTQVVSPGVVLDDQSLSARTNNYLMACVKSQNKFTVVLSDVTTGEVEYFHAESISEVYDEIATRGVREVIYPESQTHDADFKNLSLNFTRLYHHGVSTIYADADFAGDLLIKYYGVPSLDILNLGEGSENIAALGLILGYLGEVKTLTPGLLAHPRHRVRGEHLILDENTIRNLEIFKTMRDDRNHGTLLWHLDMCQTPMGSRKLADCLRMPLLDKTAIGKRLDAVEALVTQNQILSDLSDALKDMADVERLANKVLVKSANARDLSALALGLSKLPRLREIAVAIQTTLTSELALGVADFSEAVKRIEATLAAELPHTIREGGLIAQGVSHELDELREIEKSGKGYIAALEAKEKEATGINSLKIRYNNVFGYYIEITNTHKDKAPAHYHRKQTLSNAERYITDELKQYESKVLGASERIKTLEYEIFCTLRDEVATFCPEIKTAARAVAMLDVLAAFAHVAREFRCVRPEITDSSVIDLKGARHPVLERLSPGENFVPNDIILNDDKRVMIITGPNMAGKSTLMRQVGLIAIMAQAGAFVPCDEAQIGLCDRVFTRVGAHDHLQKGLSTFMVEMVETAAILREATSRSLVLLDEIGRGTSTFDGLSIAWAVAEDINNRVKARTLFATHYHELCDMAETHLGIVNFHMAVKEYAGQIVFLRQLKAGATNRSYGVAVAAMAGLPREVIARAKEILKLLEVKDLSFQSDLEKKDTGQMSIFDVPESELVKRLKEIDVNRLTPIEALNLIQELKDMAVLTYKLN